MFRSAKNQAVIVGKQVGDTVLVLGAGASTHLGYPLGSGLVEQIKGNSGNEGCAAFKQLRDMGFGRGEILEFHSALASQAPRSIDDFLSIHQESLVLGRAAIAQVLIGHEDPIKLVARDNWYWQLGWYFRESFRINEHPPAIVTFNYDRSLDKFIHDAIKGIFPNSFEYYRRFIRILHVHGRLGYLDSDGVDGFVRRYGCDSVTPEQILKSAEGIRVMPELSDDYGYDMKCAQQVIANAKKVLFLGFSYHEQNLVRLRVEAEDPSALFKEDVQFLGTSVGMTPADIRDLEQRSGGQLRLQQQIGISDLLDAHLKMDELGASSLRYHGCLN